MTIEEESLLIDVSGDLIRVEVGVEVDLEDFVG